MKRPETMTLANLDIGNKARITSIAREGQPTPDSTLAREELERRLLEAGFLEGEIVEVVHFGPIGRDPIAVRVNETLIALRRSEAVAILVEPVEMTD